MVEWHHSKARRIAENHVGKIPIGFVVHHLDENPRNNDPDNLVIMSVEEHTSLHQAGRRKKKDE